MIALILHSCWRLAKLGMEDRVQWAIAVACFVVTVAVQAEVAILFIAAGLIGLGYYGTLRRRTPPTGTVLVGLPIAKAAPLAANSSVLGKLLAFFLKAGSLTFGSGLVIVPFLERAWCRRPAGSIRISSWSQWRSAW